MPYTESTGVEFWSQIIYPRFGKKKKKLKGRNTTIAQFRS